MRWKRKPKPFSLILLVFAGFLVFRADFFFSLLPGQSIKVIESVTRIPFNEAGVYLEDMSLVSMRGALFIAEDNHLKKIRSDGKVEWEKSVKTNSLKMLAERNHLYLIDQNQGHVVLLDDQGTMLASVYGLGPISFSSVDQGQLVLIGTEKVLAFENALASSEEYPLQKGKILHAKQEGNHLYFTQLTQDGYQLGHDLFEVSRNGLILEGHTFEGEVILDFEHRGDGLWVITNKQIYRLLGEERKEYPLENEISGLVLDGDLIYLSFVKKASPDLDVQANEGILVLTRALELKDEVYFEHTVEKMKILKDWIIIASGETLYFYDEAFQLLQKKVMSRPVDHLMVLNDQTIAVITHDLISLVHLK